MKTGISFLTLSVNMSYFNAEAAGEKHKNISKTATKNVCVFFYLTESRYLKRDIPGEFFNCTFWGGESDK